MVARKAEIDDRKIGGKKTTVTRETHKILNTNQENELLGLRTGLRVYAEKPVREVREVKEEKTEEKKEEVEEKPKRKTSGRVSGDRRKYSGERRAPTYQKEGYLKPDQRKSGVKPKSSRGGRPQGQTQRTAGPKVNLDDNAFPTL